MSTRDAGETFLEKAEYAESTPSPPPTSPKHESPLERLSSRISVLANECSPAPGPVEPRAGTGVTMIAESGETHHREQYIFKRMHRDMPLPSNAHSWCMLMTLFLVMFLAGWNDASQGPLLPSLQAYYNIDYLIISLIWVFNAIGFGLAGISNVWLTDRLGFGLVAPFGSFLQVITYCLICWGGPYPLFCFAFVLNGMGLGLQDAQVNALTSRLPNANVKMFLMHAIYGLGATVSPLVSTQFVKQVQSRVYLYYAVSLGLALFTVFALLVVFQLRTDDQIVGRRGPETVTGATDVTETETAAAPVAEGADTETKVGPTDAATADATADPEAQASPAPRVDNTGNESGTKMKWLLRSPTVWLMAIYLLVYVGVEVTIGGWATSFLIDERGGNDSSGYVSAGYFGGLTLGRIVLIPVTTLLGRNTAIWVYTLVAIALEIVVWTVHSVIGNAVAYAFVGIALGPMYPIVMMVIVDILPGEMQTGAIGLVASMGQVGSAIMPFITGGIAQRHGVWILQPLMIAFMGLSLITWAFMPRGGKRIKRFKS